MAVSDLRGKTAVVTGAASGIGLAMTERFVGVGARVVMADVEEAALVREATRLQRADADVLAVLTDVTDPAQVENLRDQALTQYGAVHVVCNNAGVAPAGPMLTTTAADWRWIVDVNVLGVAYGVVTFGPLLVEQGEGHIVNTASEAGLVTTPTLGMYCATKHAVVGLSESLYHELAPQGIGVSCLCPNLVKTSIFHSERNRPHGAQLTAQEHAVISPLRESIDAMGIAPSQVATDVIDAVTTGKFWIFTHPITKPVALSRFDDIQADRNPTNAYDRLTR
ncbi:MAG TPA: SDR family NAD(P)-dependent oxidoreductase [Acidimicrobiales bacterium]|nr:SDR family NAD(P)-dependent oxidoreductase [Acidimicrobiales bacterium]